MTSPRKDKSYFVYCLLDAEGVPVYIGRSCSVASRIRAHHSEATHPFAEKNWNARKTWIFEVRSVSMIGPFSYEEVIKRERLEIEKRQPRGNRDFTIAHGWTPGSNVVPHKRKARAAA